LLIGLFVTVGDAERRAFFFDAQAFAVAAFHGIEAMEWAVPLAGGFLFFYLLGAPPARTQARPMAGRRAGCYGLRFAAAFL